MLIESTLTRPRLGLVVLEVLGVIEVLGVVRVWTTFLVLYGDLAKELRAFADVADAWLATLPNRPRKLARDESGVEADEDLDDGEGAA